MKKRMILVLTVLFLMVATSAMALYMPPNGPLYISFANIEQISPTQSIVAPSGATEVNWGVLSVDTIFEGNIENETQNFPQTGTSLWANDGTNGQITGVFAGLTLSPDVNGNLNSSGGSMYLYWDDQTFADLSTVSVADRTGDFTVTNFTDGVFLAKIDFMEGALSAALPNTSITGTVVPTDELFFGLANSFGEVDTSVVGAWTEILDTDYFTTALADNNADLKFRNIYERYDTGHVWDDLDNGIFGADSSDPARAYVVPEPSTFILLGVGLLGFVGYSRRRK